MPCLGFTGADPMVGFQEPNFALEGEIRPVALRGHWRGLLRTWCMEGSALLREYCRD